MSSVDSQTAGIVINLIIGTVVLLVSLILFDILRGRIPTIFEARRTLNTRRTNLDYHNKRVYSPAPPSRRAFGWICPVLRLELETISETHGPDIALYLRFLRFMCVLFIVLLIPTIPLLPVYYTADNKDLPEGDDLRTVGIQQLSLANLKRDDSWRFWITLAADYIIVIVVLVLLYREFTYYSKIRRRYRASDNPANYAILVQDIPQTDCSEEAVHSYWSRLFPNDVERVYFVHDASKLVTKKTKFWQAVTLRERAEWNLAYNTKLDGQRPTHKIGSIIPCAGSPRERVDSIRYYTERQSHYSSKLALYQQEIDPRNSPPTHAAIVVFKNRRTAAVASQTNFSGQENQWRVTRAPEPNAVNWNSIPIPGYQCFFRYSVTVILTMLLTIFWIIPVTIIMSFANLSKLAEITINEKQPFSFLEDVMDWSPVVRGFIESTLPAVILSVFLGLIPTFIRMFISIARISSLATVDERVRDFYFNFVVFSNFLFVIVAGSLLEKLAEIIETPSKVISFLASSAPKQGSFIMNFVILKGLSETPKELLQIGRVLVRWFFLTFLARTPRQRTTADTGNTIFAFFRYYAMAQLIALLGLVYSTISPLIVPCCLLYFITSYFVMKYNLCYSMFNHFQTGGRMYGGALYGVWIGLFLHLLTMIGIFGLNSSPAQSVLSIIPAVVVACFLGYLLNSFRRILEHGSALETMVRIEEMGDEDTIEAELAEKYIHPGFIPLPDPVENLNGVDGNDGSMQYEHSNPDPEEAIIADPEAPTDIPDSEAPTDIAEPVTQNSMSVEEWTDAKSLSKEEWMVDGHPR